MRARRRFRRRFGSKPLQRQRTAWSTAFFETSLDITSPFGLDELVLLDPLADLMPTTVDYTREWRVKRIIFNAVHQIQFLATASQFGAISILQALYVIDREDTDSDLAASTGLGTILEGGATRVLWTDVRAALTQEMVAPAGGGTDGHVVHEDFWRTQVDLKFPVKLQGSDQILVYGSQLLPSSGASNTLSALTINALTRVLVVT